jgi:hypothetical protein
MRTYLLIDMSNMLYRAFHANIKENDDILTSMCHHSALMSMQYLYNKYKPDEIVAIFDSHSWRKDYTKYGAITHKPYKGNRRKDLTQKEKEQFEVFDGHIEEFYEYLRDYSALIVLKRNMLECDDIMAGFVDKYTDDKHIIISSDKDFIQLLNHPNVALIEPEHEKARSLADWNFDSEFFMFEKCLRGDAGDNVQSSYPRLQKKKIDAAYGDAFLTQNIMEHEFDVEVFDADGNLKKHHYKTSELYVENEILMDLRKQPDEIKKMIDSAIVKGMANRSKFDLKQFLKLCERYQLDRISGKANMFAKILNTNSFKSKLVA